GSFGGEDQQALRDDPAELVEAELERRDDTEVWPGAPDPPEEVGVLCLARGPELALGGPQVDRQHVVDRVPPVPLQATHPASEREAADAGVADDPDGAGEAVLLRRGVELLEEAPAFHPP